MGREAVSRIPTAQVAQLLELRGECATYADVGSQSDLNSVTRRFRAVLGEASSNQILAEITEQLFNVSVRVWQGLHDPDAHGELAQALLKEMDDFCQAASNRDADAVEKVMQDAINFYSARLRGLF